MHNIVMLIKFSKQIVNSSAEITNGERFLEVTRGEFKTLSSEMELILQSCNWL